MMNSPWETPTYNAQCKTLAIAQELAGDYRRITPFAGSFQPPFCLRVIRLYRFPEYQDFRDRVAAIAWERRH